MQILGADEVRRRIPPDIARDAIARAFGEIAAGTLEGPLRTEVGTPEGPSLLMPAQSRFCLGLKVVHIRAGNGEIGLPTILGQFLLYRRKTGELLAALDGAELTGIRTGALAGHASRLLAPGGTDVGAVLGAGHQGFYQSVAMAEAVSLREIRIWNRTQERALSLAARLRGELKGVLVRVTSTVHEALDGAGLVTAATGSMSPLFQLSDLDGPAHLNLMGAYRPNMCEAAADVVAAATQILVDTPEGCRAGAGDLIQAAMAGAYDLGGMLDLSHAAAARDGITIFKSVGAAVFDLAVAETVLGS